MITVKQESKLLEKIKSMTELELYGFWEQLYDYMEQEKMLHVVEQVFRLEDREDEIDKLKDELSDMEEERDDKVMDLATIDSICDEVDLDDTEVSDLQDAIKRIQKVCNS